MTKIIFDSPKETIAFGKKLGGLLVSGDVVALVGELGSGKTTLIKGIARGLGVKDSSHVNSPSFVILREYSGRIPLYHFDIYRLNNPSDLDSVGYKDFFYGNGASVIEWADKIRGLLPDEYLEIELVATGENERQARIYSRGQRYENLEKKCA